MKHTLTFKILALITAAFLVSGVAILLLADRQLTRIIDAGQEDIYQEKVQAICALLRQADERLRKTGMVEAYREDFQLESLKDLRRLYYHDPGQRIYPFILDTDGRVLLHPKLPYGDLSVVGTDILAKLLAVDEGDFEYVYQGQEKWCHFKRFPPWNWVVGYAVPLDLKYADARRLRAMLVSVMAGVGLLVLAGLGIVVSRFTKPIARLTKVTAAMAAGDLDIGIEIKGQDEVGMLARSFVHMRDAVRQTIAKLERENSERRKAEAALAVEKERLFVTLRSIGDGVISTDVQGRVVLLNKAAEEMTGWRHDEAAGKALSRIFRLICEETGEECEDPALQVVGDGRIHEFSNRVLVARDGREIHVTDSAAPIIGPDSTLIGVVLVFRDVTEQLRTEQELRKITKLESVGVLAGGIAHDFNNILAAILGNIGLALVNDDLPAQARHVLGEAEKATLRARDLTQQLLTFAKGGDPVRETASLDGVIRDSAAFVLHGDKVACRFDIPDDLWLVDIDKGQISQVIQNLVINAGHAMPEGGTVTIRCANVRPRGCPEIPGLEDGRYVKIQVEDSGIGIPENVLERIFDPYFTTKQEGSGLGLAISHSIVTKHGGRIAVDSTPGSGTVFTICLPASEHQEAAGGAEAEDAAPGTEGARVLLMDDDAMVRGVAGAMLRQLGHEVEEAADGMEAVEAYRRAGEEGAPFDLVIMDLTVPGGMGGLEALARIREFAPDVRAVVSSGYANDPIMAHCREHGFAAAIGKPYQLREMARVLDSLLGGG